MLYCGILNNGIVETALCYLPDNIWNQINGKIAITTLNSDACRLAQKICKHDEIVVLSPWIFTYIPAGACEADREFRYFIFCILHEIAHAILKHSPPEELSSKENEEQEDEADKYAIEWFNKYVLENARKGLTQINIEEIREIQEEYQRKTAQLINWG